MGFQVGRAEYSLFLTLCCLVIPVVIVAAGLRGCEFRHGSEKTACDQGQLNKCLETAKAYDPDDPNELIPFLFDYAAVAKREYGKACELGDAKACLRFAEISHGGGGAFVNTYSDEDQLRGITKACEGKIQEACAKLGTRYAEGDGVKKDDARAAELFGPACEQYIAEACRGLAVLRWDGRGGLTADPAAAQKLLETACTLHDRDACRMKSSLELSLAVEEQACDGGVEASCQKAENLRKRLK